MKNVMKALPSGQARCALLSLLFVCNSGVAASDAESAVAREASDEGQRRSGLARSPIEEVVVTATRRQESIQDVPIAISTLSTAELERQGIETFEDFARQIPGVSFNRVSRNLSTFAIRGIAVNTTAGAGLQNTTSVYIGDVPITTSSFITPDVRLFDIERVEILRGPQGTLFGSGSLSGTVRIIPNQAEFNEFDAKLRVDGAMTDGDAIRQRYDAMVNVPLIDDSLALRAVAYLRDEEGWIDNLGTGKDNANGTRDWGMRASVRWEPSDRFSGTFMIMHDESDPEDHSWIDPELGTNKVSTIVPGTVLTKLTNYNLSLSYDFDWATLESSTTYSDFKGDYDQDFNGILRGTFPGFVISTRNSAPAIVQETRLVSKSASRLQWTLGAFYIDREADTKEFRSTDETFLRDLNITGLDEGVFFRTLADRDEREIAGFGEVSWSLTDTLTATAGIRYSNYRRELSQPSSFNQTGVLVGAVRAGGDREIPPPTIVDLGVIGPDTSSELSSKFSLSWRPTESATFYVTAAEGFRNAIPNTNAGVVSQVDPTDFVIPDAADADNLWNFEIGMKADWLDGSLRTNVAAFYIPWEDIQTLGIRPSDGTRFFANAGDAEAFGLEAEILAYPSNNLELGLSLTLQEAEIVSLTDQQAAFSGAVDGSRLTSPEFKASGFAQYTWMMGGRESIYLRADLQHVGSYPNTQPNAVGNPDIPNPAFQKLAAYENLNASLGWVSDKVAIVLYGENLLDNDDIIFRQPDTSVIGTFATLRPRTVGLRATWGL